MEKAADLSPEKLTDGKKDFTTIKHTFERLFEKGNPDLQVGGLPSGSGFAIGPIFQWSNSTDSVRAGFYAVGSVAEYYRFGTGLTFPKFAARSLALSLETNHADAPCRIHCR
jgi:hypothetical protein